jgi:hypothetical protein
MTLTCCGTAASWDADALPPAVCTRLRGLFGLDDVPDTLAEAVAAVETDSDADADIDGDGDADAVVHAAVDTGADAGTDTAVTPAWDACGPESDVESDRTSGEDAAATPARPFGAAGLVDASGGDPATVEGDHRVLGSEGTRAVALPSFADALAVAALTGSAASVETVDPLSGEPITVRVDEAGEIDPDGTDAAVVTLGVGPGVWGGAAPTRTDVRAEVGPYVRAFATRRTARRWESASEDPVATLEPGPAAPLGRLLTGAVEDPAADVAWHVPDQVAALHESRIGTPDAGAVRSTSPRRVDE